MRRSDRAGMGPEANDHTWCLPRDSRLAAWPGCSAGRLLAAPGWGLRRKTFSLSPFDSPVPHALEQYITIKVGIEKMAPRANKITTGFSFSSA